MPKRVNGSLPPGKHVAKGVKQVTGAQTAGNLLHTAHQAYADIQKTVAGHQGRALGEPRVYVIVEQDFIKE